MEDRQSKIDYIYQFINNLGLPNIGNLSSLTQEDQDKTYDCFWEFINKFQREQSIRQEMADKWLYLQGELKDMNYRADRLTDTNADLESEVTRLQNMISTNNLKFKQEKDKLTQERDDLRKDNLKLNSRDVQFQHDLKKHESAYAKLQDQLRKALQDREPIKNTIEVTQSLHSNGISVEAVKGDHEFLYFLQKGYESSLEEASEIINMLLSSLNLVFKATEKIVEFKLKVKMAWKDLQIEENSKETEKAIKGRIDMIKQVSEDLEDLEEDEDFPGHTVPQLKQLLTFYKDTIEQHQILLMEIQEN